MRLLCSDLKHLAHFAEFHRLQGHAALIPGPILSFCRTPRRAKLMLRKQHTVGIVCRTTTLFAIWWWNWATHDQHERSGGAR